MALPNGGLIGLVVEVTEPVGLPDDPGRDEGQRGDGIASAGRLLAIVGEEGTRVDELLVGNCIEPTHLLPQGFGFGECCAVGFSGVQPNKKSPLILGAVLAIVPPGQPCGSGGLGFFRSGGSVG